MAAPDAIEQLKHAKVRLRAAQQEHAAFANCQSGIVKEDLAEEKRLLTDLREAMAEYWQAFKEPANT